MTQFSLHGLTEQSTEIKALKRGLEKGTGQIIVSVELDKKLKKIDDVVTRGVSLFFEQGQSLYVVFRKNGDHIQIKQNGKLIPFSGQLNYANSVKLFNKSVEELAGFVRDYQQKFDKLQARKNLKQIDGMVAKNEKQRKIAVSTQIKQLTELSANLDSEIATMTKQNTLLESEVLQLEQQSVAISVEPISEPKDLSVYTEKYDDLRTAVHEFFKENLKGKVVKTVIGDVHILGSSWQKKLKQNVHIDEIKAKSIPFIPQILMQGDYEGRTLKNKVRKDDYIAFHAFNKEIQIDDNNVIVRLLVGERENNQYEFVVYSLYPNKKSMLDAIENPTMVASENAEIMLGSEHILHDDDDDVNMLDDVRDGKSGWNIEIVSITPINQALSTEPTQNDENTSATNEPTKELFDEYKQKAKQYGFNIETEKHHFLESGKFYIKKGQYVNDKVHHSFELNANVKSTPVFSLTLYKEMELETIETIVADDFDELLLKASQWIERTDNPNGDQADIDFLNNIIAGKVDVLADDFAEKSQDLFSQNDNEPTQPYSSDNPFKGNDSILADRYEKRANALTQSLLNELIAKAEKAGYVVNPTVIDSPHMGHFMAGKQIGNRKSYIIGSFKNSSYESAKRASDDFKITFLQGEPNKLKHADPDNSHEIPKFTSDINQAIEWGDEWLESANSYENLTDNTALTSQSVADILVNEYGWQYNSNTSITLGRYINDKFGEFTVSADIKDDDIIANQPLTNVFIGGIRDVVQDAKDFHRRALDWLDSYQSKPVSNENEPNNGQNMNNPNYTQSDIDYLKSIINGTLDLETVDMDKMIEIGEKDEHDPMYEQALQIVSDYLDEMSK